MSGFVKRNVRRTSWTLLLCNFAILAAVIAGVVYKQDYLYNAFKGPFPIEKEDLLDGHRSDPRQEYFSVNFGELRESGFTRTVTYRGSTTRTPFLVAAINERFLLVEGREGSLSPNVTGCLRPLEPEERRKIVDAVAERNPDVAARIEPYLFDTRNYATTAQVNLTMGSILALVCAFNVMRACIRIVAPESHSVYRRLAAMGDVAALEAEIDADVEAGARRLGPCRFTRNWVMRATTFGFDVMRMSDVIWMYKKVIRRYYNGIPVGKSFAAVLRDCHGRTIEVPCSEGISDQLLSGLSVMAPWAFFGYDGHILHGWKHDRRSMIDTVAQRRSTSTRAAPPAAAA